jgi:nucleoside phosphorylase
MNKLEKIQKTLFGKSLSSIDTLILAPIQPLFDEFSTYFTEQYQGWWSTGRVNSSKKILVVKSPIGTHIADAIVYAPSVKNIFLVGYCGAITKNLQVGDIFSCTRAFDKTGNNLNAKSTLPPIQKAGDIYLVDNFYSQEDQKFIQFLNEMNISCVDMETKIVFDAAKRKNPNSCAYGASHIITDTISKPFYEASVDDLKMIRKQTKLLVKETIKYFKKEEFYDD